MHAVVVTFEVKPEHWTAFRAAMLVNAAASLQEPGCHYFDVCEAGTTIFLYELYEDAAAFESHLQTPHFLAFAAATSAWLAGRSLSRYARIDPG